MPFLNVEFVDRSQAWLGQQIPGKSDNEEDWPSPPQDFYCTKMCEKSKSNTCLDYEEDWPNVASPPLVSKEVGGRN